MRKILLVICALLAQALYAAEDVSYPGFIKKINEMGINHAIFDDRSSQNLEKYIQNQLDQIKSQEENDPEADKDQLVEFENFFKMARKYLKAAKEEDNWYRAFRHYTLSLRVIYSIESSIQPGVPYFELNDIPNLIHRLDTNVPFVGINQRHVPIGTVQAQKESDYLIDPETNNFISKEKLAELSHDEISRLDISEEHPVWVSEKFKSENLDMWELIENWTQDSQAKALEKKILKKLDIDSLEEHGLDRYNLHQARKVLFMTKIKDSATSPKINTKDSFGEKWKLKWGNEVQTEPFVNRLVTRLGAKFTDLVYANKPGVDGLVLILEDKEDAGDCDHINTVSLFKSCLQTSTYDFLVEPYILNSGIITEENQNLILKNLPKSGLKKYSAENLIGREFVTFKESMVEFKSDKIMTRAGAPAGSFLGAEKDRVGRAYLMIAAYLYNIDQKDFNNKAVIAKDFLGKKKVYIEYAHDIGASLGKPGQSLHINGLSYGRGFMRHPYFYGNDIIIRQMMIYRPKAWLEITFADAMWMTRKILKLTKNDFEEFASYTHWPKYMQEALVQMMRLRRNRMAVMFRMMDELPEEEKNIEPLTISLDLSTPEKRAKVADKYKLNINDIENLMYQNDLIDRRGRSRYQDYLVKRNKVVSCRKSIITNLLEKTHFPSGLERRQKRSKDNKPLPNCRFQVRNRGSVIQR